MSWEETEDLEALKKALKAIGDEYAIDVEEFVKGKPSRKLMQLADVLHTAYCTEAHEGEFCCAYINESLVMSDPFDSELHKKWLRYGEKLVDSTGLSIDSLIDVIRSAYGVVSTNDILLLAFMVDLAYNYLSAEIQTLRSKFNLSRMGADV